MSKHIAPEQGFIARATPRAPYSLENLGLSCDFLGLSQQRPSLDRGTEPVGKNSQPAFEETHGKEEPYPAAKCSWARASTLRDFCSRNRFVAVEAERSIGKGSSHT